MKTSFIVKTLSIAFAGMLCIEAAHAITCANSDVKVTSIQVYSGVSATATLSTVSPTGFSADAYDCAGAYDGNATPYPKTNLGYQGDGLLNGAPQQAGHSGDILFPGGAFVQSSDLSNLQGKGNIDPGWILLGTVGFNSNGTAGAFKAATLDGNTSVILSSFFSVQATGAGKGTWQLTPDALVAQRALPILGNNYFDQFALVIKQATSFAAYDFTAKQFGVTKLTANDPIYNWGGTYDVSNTLLPAGISHIDIYARDPGSNGQLPEPSSLALIGLGLIGLARIRKGAAKAA